MGVLGAHTVPAGLELPATPTGRTFQANPVPIRALPEREAIIPCRPEFAALVWEVAEELGGWGLRDFLAHHLHRLHHRTSGAGANISGNPRNQGALVVRKNVHAPIRSTASARNGSQAW